MILNAADLLKRTPIAVTLRGLCGEALGEIHPEYLHALCNSGLVFGRGTRTKVKYVQLLVEQDQVARMIGERESTNRRERARTPGDLLARMIGDRTTVRKERWPVRHSDGAVRAALVFWHKAVQLG